LGLTHLSLNEALQLKGFNVEICVDRFLPYTTQGALPTHPALVWLYLKIPIAWRFFGKQFFIVAKKPMRVDEESDRVGVDESCGEPSATGPRMLDINGRIGVDGELWQGLRAGAQSKFIP
jgi:hypothetical protein